MDANLILIFGFVIIIGSIAIGAGSAIQRRNNDHEERKLELLARTEEAKTGHGKSSEAYQNLEKRVRVLERIATDRSPDLASQIEDLRGQPDLDLKTNEAEKV